MYVSADLPDLGVRNKDLEFLLGFHTCKEVLHFYTVGLFPIIANELLVSGLEAVRFIPHLEARGKSQRHCVRKVDWVVWPDLSLYQVIVEVEVHILDFEIDRDQVQLYFVAFFEKCDVSQS